MPRPLDGTANSDAALRAKAVLIHERLCEAYRCPIDYFHSLDPLSELVSSMLSHRTRNADSGRAFKALRKQFADWAAVRDAPTANVEKAIEAVTWPELKAPRIQQVLREITLLRGGDLSLDFLGELSVSAARTWLEQLPGVGPKTSAAVLSFSTLRKPALPVDSHHHRVAVRVGLIPSSLAVGPSHEVLAAQLPQDWNAQQVYDNHEVLMIHGQRCCFHYNPACRRCPILDLCPTGQQRLGSDRGQRNPGVEPEQAVSADPQATSKTDRPGVAKQGRVSGRAVTREDEQHHRDRARPPRRRKPPVDAGPGLFD